jgi:acetyl-CoA synthetase
MVATPFNYCQDQLGVVVNEMFGQTDHHAGQLFRLPAGQHGAGSYPGHRVAVTG